MKLRYWTDHSKRKNSTKQANLLTGTEIDINLLDASSVINPIFQTKTVPDNANYFYIADFNRYYFVDVVTKISKDITEFKLEVDVLASYKSNIGSTSAYIAYSSTGYDTNITDPRLVAKTTKTLRYSTGTTTYFSNQGCFALSIIGEAGSANGFASTYIMDSIELSVVCAALMGLSIEDRFIKAIYSPFDAVISCTWLPIDYSVAVSQCNNVNIHFGDYDSGITGHKLSNAVIGTQVNLTHSPRYTDFRAMQPYTSYALYIPNYGIVDLNASDIRDFLENSNLPVGYAIDLASGDMSVMIGNPNVQTLQFNIGVSCPIAQTSSNMAASIGGVAGTVGGAVGAIGFGVTGNIPGAIASGIGALASAANTAMSYNSRSTSIKGGISGRSMVIWGSDFKLIEYTLDTENPSAADYIAKWGRPVGVTHAISTHSGYVQCEGASVDMPGSAIEKQRVNEYLNTGFYYE